MPDALSTVPEPAPAMSHQGGPRAERYVVLEEIGRGGAGLVYRAYDPKLQREVALKIVRSLAAESSARLIVEARAMARLSHQNVVAIYDVELAAGDVVLVMEYVPGSDLRRWIESSEQSWMAVVRKFIAAGRGLAAAHRVGLLHRDFKPANVLVSEDGSNVKVTDFGLAKLDRDPLSTVQPDGSEPEQSLVGGEELTETGTVVGTPRYMAPEQHRRSRLSAATDQYSFCVALWEALCGRPPFSDTDGGLVAAKEAGPPRWPGAENPRSAEVPQRIASALGRGLAANPAERWCDMSTLLDELREAARTRRGWIWMPAMTLLAVGGVVAWYGAFSSDSQVCQGAADQLVGAWDGPKQAAVQQRLIQAASYGAGAWARVKSELDTYTQEWVAMHTATCEATAIRGEQSSEVMDLRMACLHRAKTELRVITDTFVQGNEKVVQHTHELVRSLPRLDRCADVESLLEGVAAPPEHASDLVEAIREHVARSKAQRVAGRYDQARTEIETARELLGSLRYAPTRADVAIEHGLILDRQGEYDGARRSLEEAVRVAASAGLRQQLADASLALLWMLGVGLQRYDDALQYEALARGLTRNDSRRRATLDSYLGAVHEFRGDYARAQRLHERSLALRQDSPDPDPAKIAASKANLAIVLTRRGQYDEAERLLGEALPLFDRSLGHHHPHTAHALVNLGAALRRKGRYNDALEQYREALAIFEETLDPDHPRIASALAGVGGMLVRQGRHAEAETELRRAIAIGEAKLGHDHPTIASIRGALAGALQGLGKLDDALQEYRAVAEILRVQYGAESARVAAARGNVGLVLQRLGQHDSAETEIRAAVTMLERAHGPHHPHVNLMRSNLAEVLLAREAEAEAEAELRKVLSSRVSSLPANHPALAQTRASLAQILFKRGETAEAGDLAELALAPQDTDDAGAWQTAVAAFILARISWKEGDRDRARALAQRALNEHAVAEAAGDADPQEREAVERWLRDHPG